jgi:hypothetical protein
MRPHGPPADPHGAAQFTAAWRFNPEDGTVSPTAIMIGGLFILAVLSGILGLGVAFAAVPFLSLFLPDLVHQVLPLSVLLNGITASNRCSASSSS